MSKYHTHVPLEKTNLPTVEVLRRWRPAEPIPRDFDPDPHEALRRHAEAHEAWELEQAAKVLTFTTRSTSPAGGQRRAA